MSNATITLTITRIEIVRHNNYYFYNRSENGRYVVEGERISSGRARDIIAANTDQVEYQDGEIRFDPGMHSFSWTGKIIEEVTDG